MSNFEDDILQPLAEEDLLQYAETLKENLPIALRAHHFLLIQYKWRAILTLPQNHNQFDTISNRCKFNFYKHRNGNPKNCTFVAITIEGNPNNVMVTIYIETDTGDCINFDDTFSGLYRIYI